MEFGVAQRPKVGNLVSGDAHLLLEEGSRVVVALTDGLGSGERAYLSSQLALQGVADFPDAALPHILSYSHYNILAAGGVGAMITVLRLDQEDFSLEYAGVGNLRFLPLSRQVVQPITRFGYLGVRLPSLRSVRFSYTPGDTFVLHTDGISSRFHLKNHLRELGQGAQMLADRALAEYGKIYDDASIVVVKT